jgi:uncharacterized protein
MAARKFSDLETCIRKHLLIPELQGGIDTELCRDSTERMPDRFKDGVEFFNRGRFFDAHEAWEEVWRDTTGPDRLWLQGLVQIAVALHHHSTGNLLGARSVLSRAIANLTECPDEFCGLDIDCLKHDAGRAREQMTRNEHIVPFHVRQLGRPQPGSER